jgi:hypothetical protein
MGIVVARAARVLVLMGIVVALALVQDRIANATHCVECKPRIVGT